MGGDGLSQCVCSGAVGANQTALLVCECVCCGVGSQETLGIVFPPAAADASIIQTHTLMCPLLSGHI